MLSAYERRLILSYLSNAFLRLRSRDEEARNLLRWLRKHEDQLEIPYPLTAGDDAEEAVGRKLPDEEVPTLEWRRVGKALRNALAAARQARPDRTARRLRRLAKTTRLSRTDTAVLELVLRASTGSLVGSMIEDIGDSRHWSRRFFKLGNPVLPCLLGLSAGAVYGRFAPDAPLVTSGLVSIDDDGDVTLIDRLTRLHWLPKEAGSDVQHLLLDEADPSELRWSDFDHVSGDRDHLERLLKGALRSGQKGVNVLVYGLPGTGKTEFCKTLAARLEAPLYSVGESDANGGEPSRNERMQELRLAQRLLAGDRRSILLFDEMEDLLSRPEGMLAALFGSSRIPRRSAEGSKVFMNRLLEETPVPVLWTSNAARGTSPVLLRRMMFAPGTASTPAQGPGTDLGATACAPWYRVGRGGCSRLGPRVRCNAWRGLRGHCGRPTRWRHHRGRTPRGARTRAGPVGRHAANSTDTGKVRSRAHPGRR